jgi:hypothetical protein
MEKTANIKLLEEHLAKINYKIRSHGCGHFGIVDDNGKHTDWMIYGVIDTRIYREPEVGYQHSVNFGLKGCELYELDDNCVGIKAKDNTEVFLQFYKRNK